MVSGFVSRFEGFTNRTESKKLAPNLCCLQFSFLCRFRLFVNFNIHFLRLLPVVILMLSKQTTWKPKSRRKYVINLQWAQPKLFSLVIKANNDTTYLRRISSQKWARHFFPEFRNAKFEKTVEVLPFSLVLCFGNFL